jgi:hypothetical protein
MNTSALKPLAGSVSFDADSMSVEFRDGRRLSVPLAYFPRLLNATESQRLAYEISGGGVGLHWDELDEDISVEHLLMGMVDRTNSPTLKQAA